jgi:hypothetical protein
MCTVTIIRTRAGLRLVSARDEQHARPRSIPPASFDAQGVRAIAPIDPQGGGTWIGVNARGWAVTLLNRNPPDRSRPTPGSPSRGRLVMAALGARDERDIERAIHAAAEVGTSHFRLIATNGAALIDAEHDSRALNVRATTLGDRPVMFSSSGLGDERVEPARRALFDTWFAHAGEELWPDLQDALHAHAWHGAPHLGFNMLRVDAGTVSLTEVELTPAHVRLRTRHREDSVWGAWLELPRGTA